MTPLQQFKFNLDEHEIPYSESELAGFASVNVDLNVYLQKSKRDGFVIEEAQAAAEKVKDHCSMRMFLFQK